MSAIHEKADFFFHKSFFYSLTDFNTGMTTLKSVKLPTSVRRIHTTKTVRTTDRQTRSLYCTTNLTI